MNGEIEILNNLLNENKAALRLFESIRQNQYKKLLQDQQDLYQLDKQINGLRATLNIYKEFDIEQVNNLSEERFNEVIHPLYNALIFKNDLLKLHEEVRRQFNGNDVHNAISIILGSNAATPTNASIVAYNYPSYFRNSPVIKSTYDEYGKFVQLEDAIQYIQNHLPYIVPDISREFATLLTQINTEELLSPTCGQLVNLRTLIYYKLYGKKNSTMNNKFVIKKFIFGKRTFNSNYDSLVAKALKIWNDLSGNIKEGKSTMSFNRMVFNDLILNLEQIIIARNTTHL